MQELSRAPVIAATAIARSAAGPTDDPNLQKDAPVEEIPPWRRGRAGTALGRAVHAVLQSIDLATGAGLEGAARAQAAAEGIPDRSDEVARRVRAALDAPSVREAVAGRYWREVYVAAPVEGCHRRGVHRPALRNGRRLSRRRLQDRRRAQRGGLGGGDGTIPLAGSGVRPGSARNAGASRRRLPLRLRASDRGGRRARASGPAGGDGRCPS